MKKLIRNLLLVLLLAVFLVPASEADAAYYCVPWGKVYLGEPFTYFEMPDIYNQIWVSSYLRGKPVIILTAHRYQRYEVLKWAESFRQDFAANDKAYVLWVVNLNKFPWTTSRETIVNQWRYFNPPVPMLLDWNGVIGKSLKINYNIPNIIVLDAYGRLVMHEMHSYTPDVYRAVANRIRWFLPRRVGSSGKVGYSM
ncbi:MAG: hypothetical protein GX221_06315 [Candidatus Riflebacteria bacterium]|nr:hypothetical protein [Candidatus Riflebacteria bacterium]